MTCGVCHPEAFRDADQRVFGYVAEPHNGASDTQVRQAYYVGAQLVLTDIREGRVMDRPSFRMLRKIMRPGDKLILADETALGTKPKRVYANIASIEADGVEVAIIRKEFFEKGAQPHTDGGALGRGLKTPSENQMRVQDCCDSSSIANCR